MPTYGPLDCTVSLLLWEPLKGKTIINKAAKGTPMENPWDGQHVEKIKEDYFNSPGGVDFIGPSSSPFYLINAGQDLFFNSRPKTNKGKGKEQEQDKDADVEDGILPPTPTPFPRQPASSKEDDDYSALSDIPSSKFGTSSPVFNRLINLDGPSDELGTTLKKSPPKGWNAKNPIVPPSTKGDIPKPISKPIPIKIQVDFSKTTFMPSLVTGNLSDICITIYYNGQLTHCRIIKSTTVRSSTADGKQPAFSGRRVGNELEAPFVLTPIPEADLGSSKKTLSFGERWAKINQSLFNEADEWGREGKYATFRTPLGEYLEELSKLEVPECLRGHGRNGTHAGIIDVVVAMGSSLIINNDVSALSKPERKLPEGICGKANTKYIVPKERLTRKDFTLLGDLMGEEINRVKNTKIRGKERGYTKVKCGKSSSMPPPDLLFNSHDIHSGNVNEVEGAIQDIMQALGRNIRASEAVREPVPFVEQKFSDISSRHGGPSSSQNLASMKPEPTNSGKAPTSYATSLTMTNRNDTEQPVTEPKLHPNMPKRVPQKRWKGSEPISRPKYEGRWDIKPFDIDKPTSLSTRSHRTATPSDPASATQVQIPPNGNIRPRVSGLKFEHSQYLLSKDGEDIHMGDQEDHEMLPPSPSPMARKDRITTRPEINGLGLYKTPQEHAREAYWSLQREFPQSGGKSVYPGFGIDGTVDLTSSRTTRSGTSFGSPDIKDTPGRTTRAGTSFATPNTINNLKRKHSSTNVSPAVSSDGPSKKIPRLEAGSETRDLANQKAQPFNEFVESNFLINDSEHTQNPYSLQMSPAIHNTTNAISGEPEKKKRHRAAVSNRELKAVLGSHNPFVPVNESLTASFSETASSGTRSRSRGDKKINAQLRATAKAGKLGISVMHETLHLTVFRGSKVRELLMKIQSKSSIERDSRQIMVETENDLPHQKTSEISRTAGMTGVSDDLTISRVSEVLVPTASKILVSSKASIGSARKQPKTQAPPRKPLPSSKNPAGSKPGSHETLVSPPGKPLRSRKKAKDPDSVGEPVQNNKLHPKQKSAANGFSSSTTQHSQQSSFVKPRLRSNTQTSEGMTLPTLVYAPQTFESPASTDNTKSFNALMHDSIQSPAAAIALASTPDSDIPLSKLVKRKQTSLPANPPASTRNSSIPPSVLNKKKKTITPIPGSVPTPKVKSSKPNPTTPQVATPNDQTPGTQRPRSSGLSTLSSDLNWEPTDLCETSVLTYANLQNTSGWAGLELDTQSGRVFRSSRREMQGVFRASSIIMGVRYVVGVRSE